MAKPAKHSTAAEIPQLIAKLAIDDPVERDAARRALAVIGKPSVEPLVRSLGDPRPHVRWEAAKALFSIADPASAPALVRALEDKDVDVRWVAAEGLSALGRAGLEPLLKALIDESESEWLYQGAHHVMHNLARRDPAGPAVEVLDALQRPEPALAVPLAAEKALTALRRR